MDGIAKVGRTARRLSKKSIQQGQQDYGSNSRESRPGYPEDGRSEEPAVGICLKEGSLNLKEKSETVFTHKNELEVKSWPAMKIKPRKNVRVCQTHINMPWRIIGLVGVSGTETSR